MIAPLLLVVALTFADAPPAADSVRVTAPGPAGADTIPAVIHPVLTLPEVSVDRARPEALAASRLPNAFTWDIAAGSTGHALETVADLLNRSAAVRIQQYGGLGAFATVSMRGLPANETSLYLDGVPITSAAQSIISIADLPVTSIARLEVYPGGAPLSLGPATPGGAINIVTLPSLAKSQLAMVRGSFGMWEGRGSVGGSRGPWSALLHAGYQGAKGDFDYHDDNGTPFNTADDETAIRQNNRFDSGTLLGTARGPLPLGMRMTLRESAFHKRQGVPGLGAVPALHAHLQLLRSLSQLELERPTRGAWPGLEFRGSVDRTRSRFDDRAGELGRGAMNTDDHLGGEQWTTTLTSPRIPGGLILESSGSIRLERGELHDSADRYADPPGSHRDTRGASVGLRLEPWGERLRLTAARRWDHQRDALRSVSSLGQSVRSDVARELDSPQLGVGLRAPRGLEFKANWQKAARAPDFTELFGNQGSIVGNPALVPEHGESWDAGFEWTPRPRGPVTLRWTHYQSELRDLIAYVRNSSVSVRALNIASARIRGEELTAWLGLPAGFGFYGWLTRQGSIDLGTALASRGRRLPLRPEGHAYAQLGWSGRAIRVTGEIEAIGEDFLDRSNRQRAAARTFSGATLSLRAGPDLRFTLEGRNLGDVHAADVAGFPLPGRSLFVSCDLGAPRDPALAP